MGVVTDTRFLIGCAVGYFLLPRVVKFVAGKVGGLSAKPAASS